MHFSQQHKMESTLPPGVPPGARPLKITSLVNPGYFWGLEKSGTHFSQSNEKLKLLEDDITRLYCNSRVNDHNHYDPKLYELVAVFEPKSGMWVRGQMLRWEPRNKIGEFFLVDYGSRLSNVSMARQLPPYGLELPPQACQIFLYGVLPINKEYNQQEGKFINTVTMDWSTAAVLETAELLRSSELFHFSCTKTWGDVLLGDLYISRNRNTKAISLTKKLIDSGHAIHDYERFNKEIAVRSGKMMTITRVPSQTEPIRSVEIQQATSFASLAQERSSQENLPSTKIFPAGYLVQSNAPSMTRPSTELQVMQEKLNRLHQNYQVPPPPIQQAQSQHGAVPKRKEPIAGISRLAPKSTQSSMLTQLNPPSEAEVMYKPPQVRTPQPVVVEPQTSGSNPPPTNKYAAAAMRLGQKSKTGSQSSPTASTESSNNGEYWRPTLVELPQRQVPVLVQGCDLSKAIESVSKAPLHSDIHRELERMSFNCLTNLQKHMWPAVLRGQNVIAVGAKNSGKTLGFTIPLASNMLDPGLYSELKDLFGPLVLVLCTNAERATLLEKWFRKLTRNELKDYEYAYNRGLREPTPRVKVLLTYGGGAEKEKLMDLINGCHVLISTPPCLIRMIKYWEEVLANFDRLCHLVFDDADLLFEKFLPQVAEVLKLCQKSLASKERKERNLQTIVTARRWTTALEQFSAKVMTNPTIVINAGFEVHAYSNIPFELHCVSLTEQRFEALNGIVEQLQSPGRVVVACAFDYEAIEVHRQLQSFTTKLDNMMLLVAHVGISHMELIGLREKWSAYGTSKLLVLVVADTVLYETEINNASTVIHFSMPEQRSHFNTRIACIIKQCPDRFATVQEVRTKIKPKVHLIITETDTKPIRSILELMRRLKAPFPPELEAREKAEQVNREAYKKTSPLCNNLCSFGECKEQDSCPNRHLVFADTDRSPNHLPESGEVKLKILHVNSATHFAARLEEHRSPEGEVTNLLTKEHIYLPMDISEHFSKQDNRRMLGNNVVAGTICAVESGCSLYQRVKVETLCNKDKSGNYKDAWVHSLDEGWRRQYQMFQLYHLPEKLQRPVPQAVDIHLCRLMPRDEDPDWSIAVNQYIVQWLSEVVHNEQNGYFMYGKIVLSVAGRLWIDPLECRQNLQTTKVSSILFSIRHRMLDRSLALDNPSHLKKLYQLCQDAGIQLPDYSSKLQETRPRNVVTRESDESLKPSWAFLSSELDVVKVLVVASPSCFFVQRHKFLGQLDHLLNDICTYQNNLSRNRKPLDPKPGTHVIAKFLDGTWHRALVRKPEDSNGEVWVQFVDFGDCLPANSRQLLPLPDELLSKLPFQAIECTLAGICPKDGKLWPKATGDELQKLTRYDDDNTKNIILKVVSKARSKETGGWKYAVKLFDTTTYTEINDALVKAELAAWEANCGPELDWAAVEKTAADLVTNEKKKSNVVVLTKEDISSDEEDDKLPETSQLPYYHEQEEEEEKVEEVTSEVQPDETDYSDYEMFNEDEIDSDDCIDFISTMKNCPFSQDVMNMLLQKKGTNAKSSVKITELKDTDQIEELPEEPKTDDSVERKLIMSAYEPSVMWSQDDSWVLIKINLPGVEKYDLTVDTSYMDFTTRSQGRLYFLSKCLFGYVDPQRTKHCAKGLYVEVKLYKLAYFPWPRLERPLQTHKTVLDMNASLREDSDDEEDWGTPKWEAKHKVGRQGISLKPHELVLHDVSDAGESSNSEDEAVRQVLETFDPYDPLN